MMNFTDVVNATAEATGFTKKDVKATLQAYENVIINGLKAGEDISMSGFLKFTTREVGERSGVIQLGERTGQKWVKPAHKIPVVKMFKPLKELFL